MRIIQSVSLLRVDSTMLNNEYKMDVEHYRFTGHCVQWLIGAEIWRKRTVKT